MKPLSDRAIEILCVIKERSQAQDNGFWLPTLNTYGRWDWCEEFHTHSCICDTGDSAILRSLIRKGLTRKPRSQLNDKYMAQITEDGLLAIEAARESGRIEAIADSIRRRDRRRCGLPDLT